ncbi:MAG TPA: tetratricopeptide repeat protein [Pyrinomonadaceae bacterium]|nr:tetratricopeptide repeat protein [Pyrinomonadaceae bacterium]
MFRSSFQGLAAALAALVLVVCAAAVEARAQGPAASDVVLVLPFENKTNHRDQRFYHWIGESFADSLTELLNMPGIGLRVVSGDERDVTFQELKLPPNAIPSRATTIKLARRARASLVVVGNYEVTPASEEGGIPAVSGTARLIRVNEGRFGETMHFGGTLTNLQKMQGRLVFEILYQQDKALPISLNNILAQATKVPPGAFEAFVKGVLTDDKEKKSAYLQNAMREYQRVNAGAVYPQAAFELGSLYLAQRDYKQAAEHFAMVPEKDPHYVEAAFYAAYSYWRMEDLTRALGALMPLRETKLTSIYNNAGAISAQAARAEKEEAERTRLLEQATYFLGLAASSAPNDPMVRFNYGYSLLLSGKFAEAVEQLRPVIKENPRDGDALFLFAKALERSGQAQAAALNDNEARKLLGASYGKIQNDWQQSQRLSISLRMRERFDRRVKVLTQPVETTPNPQDLVAKARELYAAGRDDEALQELRNVLRVEPMNAEAYLLIGRIDQRRGDIQAAISALKTALFWDSKLVDAHILLGRIFFERSDRAMALSYVQNALKLDPYNQEAIGLQRQITTNSK